MAKDVQQTIEEFDEAVNMSRKELEAWLQTEESLSVGQSPPLGLFQGRVAGDLYPPKERGRHHLEAAALRRFGHPPPDVVLALALFHSAC